MRNEGQAAARVNVLYLVERPIQYQAPLLRRIAALEGLALTVAFETLGAAAPGGAHDAGFGREVTWDIDMLAGYDHVLAPNAASLAPLIERADVVWMHGWAGARQRAALSLAKARRTPVLMRGENTDVAMPDGWGPRGWLKRRYLDWVFNRCAGFLAIGGANRRYYLGHGVAEGSLFFMPYAVDNDFFHEKCREAAAQRETFRAGLNLEPDRPVVLFAGKLQRRKGVDLLLRAFRDLDRTHARAPYLVIVGDGEQRSLVERAVGEDDAVRFLGFRNQTELPAFYDLADVFVLASRREPWGLAVNEAMNGATAVVVSDECGCAEDLVTPACGRVVRAGDPAALRHALADLLADPDDLTDSGAAARDTVAGWNFDKDMEGLRRALESIGLAGC